MFGCSIWGLETNKHVVVDVMLLSLGCCVIVCIFLLFFSFSGLNKKVKLKQRAIHLELNWTKQGI